MVDVDRIALGKVLTILEHGDPKDGIWYLAATGDVATLQTYLNRFPNEVCGNTLFLHHSILLLLLCAEVTQVHMLCVHSQYSAVYFQVQNILYMQFLKHIVCMIVLSPACAGKP